MKLKTSLNLLLLFGDFQTSKMKKYFNQVMYKSSVMQYRDF
jgi:hypothetical protein